MIETVVAICIALVIVLLILLSTYNSLMHQRQEVRAAWSHMDEQLRLRYQLIPLLISAVQSQGGPAVEKLPAVSAAKNQAAVAFSPDELARAESALTTAIGEVLAATAHDSSQSSNAALIQIQRQLQASEKQIDHARMKYNNHVDALNSALSSFPQVLTAKAIGLRAQAEFLD